MAEIKGYQLINGNVVGNACNDRPTSAEVWLFERVADLEREVDRWKNLCPGSSAAQQVKEAEAYGLRCFELQREAELRTADLETQRDALLGQPHTTSDGDTYPCGHARQSDREPTLCTVCYVTGVEAARDKLRGYTIHKAECDSYNDGNACTCGLDALLGDNPDTPPGS